MHWCYPSTLSHDIQSYQETIAKCNFMNNRDQSMKLFQIQIGLFICRINHLMSPPSPVCWWWPGCWCRHILTGAGRWCPLGGTWALLLPAPWPRPPVSAGWQVPWSTYQHWPPTLQHVSHYRSTLCQHINIIFTCQHKSTKHVVCAIMTTFLKIIKDIIPAVMLCHMQLIFTHSHLQHANKW